MKKTFTVQGFAKFQLTQFTETAKKIMLSLTLVVMALLYLNYDSVAQNRIVSFQGAAGTNWATDSSVTVANPSTSSSSTGIACLNGTNQSYPSLNATAGYYSFTLSTTDERIDSMKVVWRSNTSNQTIVAIFGSQAFSLASSILSLPAGESGGFSALNLSGASGSTSCPGSSIIFPGSINVRSILFGRQMSNLTTSNTQNTAYLNYSIRQGGSSGSYTQTYGAGSTAYLGQVILYISKLCTPPTKTYNVTTTSNTICSGNSVTIGLDGSQSVSPAVTYQLYANGSPLPGVTATSTGSAISFAAQNPGSATTYKVFSTTADGYCATQIDGSSIDSQIIAVNTAPVIDINQGNLAGATYTQGDNATPLSIVLSAGTNPSYQWYQNNLSNPVGGNSNSYTPSTASVGTSNYFCVASVTACPSATSNTSGDIIVNAPEDPTIVVDTNSTSFNGPFGKQTVSTSSVSRSFKVSGSLLTDDITVNAPSGFEVSLSSGSGFGSSVTLNESGGTVDETTVYARFSPTLETPYSGNITCESSGATTINVPVSGEGKIPVLTITETGIDFTTTGWTASSVTNRGITGSNLDGNINVSVAAPFQVHNGDNNWNTTASFDGSSGSVSGTLSIRYNPSSGTGDNSSTVSISSTNAAGKSIAVTGKAAPLITLSSGPSTQLVKAGTAITNVVYTVTGGVASASASGLPSNVTFNNGSYTISGTPATESSYPAVYGYTVTIVGPSGTANATANDTIIVKDPNAKKIAYIINTAVSANDTKIRPYLDARYDLTNITIASVNTSYDFSPYDLVVLTEEPPSASNGMRALWGIDKPLLNFKAFATVSTTWAFASAAGANATGSTQVDVISGAETHPIFNGVPITGGKITVLSGVAGGDNGIQGTTYAGGTKLAYISGSTTNVSINEIEVGTDPSTGTPAGVKNEVLQAKYIQIGISNTSFDNVTADGLQLIGNAASYLTAASAPTLTVTNSPQTYNGSPIAATVGSNSAGAISDIKYDGSSTVPTNAGTYAITADQAANGAYSAVDNASAGTFTINPAAATATVTNSPQTYTGSPIAAVISTNSGGAQSDVKYNGSSTVPTNIGTYSVTVDIAATANYNTGNDVAAGTFQIITAQATADFRSKSAGPNNLSSASSWEYFNGTTWADATQKPGSGNNVTIQSGHTITFDEGFTIGAGKTLTTAGTANFNNQLINVQSNLTGTGAIGTVTGSITNATQVQVERFIPSTRQSWKLLAVPTTGSQTIRQAWMELNTNDAPNTNLASGYGTIISAGSSLYVGDGNMAKGGFDVVTASASLKSYNYTTGNAAFIFGNNVNKPIADTFTNGYFLFVRGNRGISVNSAPSTSSATLRSKGGINVGPVVKSLHYPGKYRLLGNPYASTIDFGAATFSENVTHGFYLWDASLGNTGGYSYFEDAEEDGSYILLSGSGEYAADNSKIQSGQAFMVIATGGPGTITFTEDCKVSGSSIAGLRPAPSTTARLHAVLSSGKQVYDGAAVLFANKFSNDIDKTDAVKLYNPAENLGVVRNGQSFVLEARGAVTAEEEVQYEIKNLKQQAYTIEFRATNMQGEAWLVDNYLGTRTALNMSIATKVNFSVTAEAKSAAADRFKVVFRPAAVTTAPAGVPSIKVSPNPVQGGIMNVSFSQQAKGRYNLKLVDLSGRLLLNTVREHAGGSATQQLALPSNLAGGTYQLVITAPDRSSSVKKVLVNTNK